MMSNQFLVCVSRAKQAFGVTMETEDPRTRRNAQRRFNRADARAVVEWGKLNRSERKMLRRCEGTFVRRGHLYFTSY
jgi:hypothetical protein